jgi:hypothetical protein
MLTAIALFSVENIELPKDMFPIQVLLTFKWAMD